MSDSCKELLLSSLTNFYNKNDNYKYILKSIIDGKHQLSLRMIDWLVTIYSKNNNVIYWISNNDNEIYNSVPDDFSSLTNNKYKKINLYLDYRAQLKSFKKINFDSFRRHDRITFIFDTNNQISIETTIGQLNFFRWAFSNKVINYAINNQKIIYDNMSKNSYKKVIKKKKNLLIPKQDIIITKCFVSFD
jgi:hypothetical protein